MLGLYNLFFYNASETFCVCALQKLIVHCITDVTDTYVVTGESEIDIQEVT